MNLYSIPKGKSASVGQKEQPIYYQLFCLVAGLFLSIELQSMTAGFITLLAFLFFNITLNGAMYSQSMRVYLFPSCAQIMKNTEVANTIYGFACGYRKWNSASICWKGNENGTIDILANCYVNGEFVEKHMLRCKTQSWVFLHIENKRRKYVFKVMTHNGKISITSIQKGSSLSFYTLFSIFIYKLYPRLGGKNQATIDTKLYMKKLATIE